MRTDEPITCASSWALPPTGITKEISFSRECLFYCLDCRYYITITGNQHRFVIIVFVCVCKEVYRYIYICAFFLKSAIFLSALPTIFCDPPESPKKSHLRPGLYWLKPNVYAS